MKINEQIAEKIAAEYNKIDKARTWHKPNYSRVYVGKNGRYIEVDAGGAADVTGMVIHQAREGAAMICEKLGVVVTAK